uniref:Uncharacterized protein n=1 Tax=Anguilla anguilla TaxID=7936 RepID=A0A0E9U0V1_ANGAN
MPQFHRLYSSQSIFKIEHVCTLYKLKYTISYFWGIQN